MDERDLLTLNAYIDGELPPAERQAFESRLAAEPELADELTRTRATVALLGMAEPIRSPRSFALDPAVYASTEQSGGLLSWFKPRGALRPVLAGASLLTSLLLFGVAFLSFTGGGGMMPTVMDAAPAMEAAELDYAEEESMAVEPQAAPMTSVAEAPVAEEALGEEVYAEEEMAEPEAQMPDEDMAAPAATPSAALTAPPQPLINDEGAEAGGLGAGDAATGAAPPEPLSDVAPVPEVADDIGAADDGGMRAGDDEASADVSNGNALTFGEDGETINPAADAVIEQPQAVLDLEDDIQRSMRRSIVLIVVAIITAVIGVTLLIPPRQQAIE